jgi:transcriptional regulator with XRE-family HTH domain
VAKKRPNVEDPLSEPTLNLRFLALYLSLGYSRASLARALDMDPSNIYAWDIGRWTISLPQLAQASKLFGVSIDQMVFGHTGRPAKVAAGRDYAAIRAALDAIEATAETRAALGEYLDSPSGALQVTDTYFVQTWAQGFEAAREDELSIADATKRAHTYAINQTALRGAVEHRDQVEPQPADRPKRVQRPRRKLPTTRGLPDE